MKKLLAGFLIVALLCAGCAAPDSGTSTIVSGGGEVGLAFSQSSSSEDALDPEFPSAESQMPTSVASGTGSSSASKSLSQSQPQAVSSQAASQAASSQATASSVIPSSSTKSNNEASLASASTSAVKAASEAAETVGSTGLDEEVRAVWISYLELETLLKGVNKATFEKNIATVFDNMVAMKLNTAIVQVRPFADAIYPSDVYPWSYLCTGTEGKNPGYDPMQIMIDAAHNRGLRFEAWINPYRIRNSGYKQALSIDNPAQNWKNNNSGAVLECDGGLYYNPGVPGIRRMIVAGVQEIVDNYNVDGIHFDDYFYPSTDLSLDAATYKEQKSDFAGMSQADWRRENVNMLVREVYSTIKSADSRIMFGISPQGNMDNNYNVQFADVKKWVQNTGYVDYICPQIYWGFEHETAPFAKVADNWNAMITNKSVKLYVGLAAYKICTVDSGAGANGKFEWLNGEDLLSRMVVKSRKLSHYDGFVLYRYDSIFRPASKVESSVKVEKSNLKGILK